MSLPPIANPLLKARGRAAIGKNDQPARVPSRSAECWIPRAALRNCPICATGAVRDHRRRRGVANPRRRAHANEDAGDAERMAIDLSTLPVPVIGFGMLAVM